MTRRDQRKLTANEAQFQQQAQAKAKALEEQTFEQLLDLLTDMLLPALHKSATCGETVRSNCSISNREPEKIQVSTVKFHGNAS